MDQYRARSRAYYGPNGYRGNGGYGGGQYGNGAYAGGYRNGGYGPSGGRADHGRFRGAARGGGYGVGDGTVLPPPLWAAMPSTSSLGQYQYQYQYQVWGRAGEEFLPEVRARAAMVLPDAMRAAEAAAREVVLRLRPTAAAERRRYDVIDYVKRLIGSTFGCEVYAFGSVPLRTYLPDGDVDLTILTSAPLDLPVDSDFIDEVYCLLSSEAKNEDAQFTVERIKIINAKVKLIKCYIDNIVVDISFNQIGGINKLCFIELVDNEIKNDHLFKKSIILIKAWCYHEGNIHGSSQGLMSTYALEILIVYVFITFHKSLHGPLEALYMFLEYYSKFNWNKYCVTLNGPIAIPKPSRSKVTVEPVSLTDKSEFFWKHMNIIDPLMECNNLGNSVSADNSQRIQDAFKWGALRLGQILNLSSEHIDDELFSFFTTTLVKHGNGHGDHVSSLENSCVDDENRSPGSSSSGLTNLRSHSSSSSENGNNTYMSRHILTSSTRVNSLDVSGSYPIVESNRTGVRQEKWHLPPFSPSNLLDLSGDLGLYLECLRCVQYNLETLFDKFLETFEKTSLAGVLDEDCFTDTDIDGRNLSGASYSQSTGDVPQRSISEVQVDELNQLFPETMPSESFYTSTDANSEVYHDPWFQNTEDVPQTNGASMHTPDMNFSLPPITDTTLSNGLPFYQENYHLSSLYMPVDRTRGTGTYIPRMLKNLEAHEICNDKLWSDKKQRQKQQDQVYVEKKPDRVNSCNGSTVIESATREPRTTMTENMLQRYANGSMGTPPLLPPRILLPHDDGRGQENLSHETLEFGTVGPFSANLLTSKFMEDFPPLAGTKKPVQVAPALAVKSPKPGASTTKSCHVEVKDSTMQSPRAGVSATQSKPIEAPASIVQSPKASARAALCRLEEESYQLKDDAHFPPLQTGTCYNTDFPPLRAASR